MKDFIKITTNPDGGLVVQFVTITPDGDEKVIETQTFPKGEVWVEVPEGTQGFPWVLEGVQ